MKGLAAISCLLLTTFLINGCEIIKFGKASPDIRLIESIDLSEWVGITYTDETGRSIRISYFNDEDGYAKALAQLVCSHLKNSFRDYSLKREAVDLKIKVVNNLLYVDLFSSGKKFGSIAYKVLDYSCFDFLAKEVICPELVGEKTTSLKGKTI